MQQVFELGVADSSVGDARSQPVGQLVVPQQRVSPHQLAVLLGEGDKAIGARPVERSLGRLHDLPLHLVSRSDDRELARSDGLVRGVIEVKRNDCRTDAEAGFRSQRPQRVRSGCNARAGNCTSCGGDAECRGRPGCTHREKTTDPHVLPPLRHQVTLASFESFGRNYRDGAKVKTPGTLCQQFRTPGQCLLWILVFAASAWIASDSFASALRITVATMQATCWSGEAAIVRSAPRNRMVTIRRPGQAKVRS